MKIHFKHFIPEYYISTIRVTKHCYSTMVFKTHVIGFTSSATIVDIDWLDERFSKIDTNLFSALITYVSIIKKYKSLTKE